MVIQNTLNAQEINENQSSDALHKKVLDTIDFFSNSSLVELEIDEVEFKLHLTKFPRETENQAPNDKREETLTRKEHFSLNPLQKKVNISGKPEESFLKILSPMAGTFYLTPSPSSPPFVKEGDYIKIGQPICIIEAMKLMNEIKSDKSGRVIKIVFPSGQTIEKGAILFFIEESES